MSRFLCDSGVWLAAANASGDETYHAAADALLRALGDRGEEIGALDLTLYETANVATRRWGSASEAMLLVAFIRDAAAGSLVGWSGAMLDDATQVAARHGLSVYDAAYVATARALGWTLVSTDVRDLVSRGLAITPDQVAL